MSIDRLNVIAAEHQPQYNVDPPHPPPHPPQPRPRHTRSNPAPLPPPPPHRPRYDDLKSAQENIELQSTILSRFDLIFIVKDDRCDAQPGHRLRLQP
jgi:hypothetical protein